MQEMLYLKEKPYNFPQIRLRPLFLFAFLICKTQPKGTRKTAKHNSMLLKRFMLVKTTTFNNYISKMVQVLTIILSQTDAYYIAASTVSYDCTCTFLHKQAVSLGDPSHLSSCLGDHCFGDWSTEAHNSLADCCSEDLCLGYH